MRRGTTLLCLAVLVLAGVPAPAIQAQDVKKQPAKKEKLSPAGTWTGRIQELDMDNGSLKLEVVHTLVLLRPYRPPQGYRVETTYRFGSDGSVTSNSSSSPIGGSGGPRVLSRTEVVTVTLPETVKVRVPPPVEFEDTGRPKRFSIKKDYKDPDRNLPGVKGALDDLDKGQRITATLLRSRDGRLTAQTILIHERRPAR
jgi:hypothetical protein